MVESGPLAGLTAVIAGAAYEELEEPELLLQPVAKNAQTIAQVMVFDRIFFIC